MSNELVNINDFKENLVNKVKTEFANMIPEDKLDQFVQEVYREFEQKELKELVLKVIREQTTVLIKEKLEELGTTRWENNKQTAHAEMRNIILESGPAMFANIMNDVAVRAIYNAKQYI